MFQINKTKVTTGFSDKKFNPDKDNSGTQSHTRLKHIYCTRNMTPHSINWHAFREIYFSVFQFFKDNNNKKRNEMIQTESKKKKDSETSKP